MRSVFGTILCSMGETHSKQLIKSGMKNIFFMFIAALLFTATTNAQSTVDSISAKYKMVPMPGALTIEKTFPVLGIYQLGTDATGMNNSSMNGTSMNNNTSNSTTTTTSNTDASTSSETATTGTDVAAANTITITLDSANKGMVWVEGLPQGKFKAHLKKSPSTYRILSQKTETGKQVSEGTLLFDPATGILQIALGKDFDEADPAAIFAMNNGAAPTDANTDNTVKVKVKTPTSKTKSKITFFTATKMQTEPATEQSATGTFDSQIQKSQQSQQQPQTEPQPQQQP